MTLQAGTPAPDFTLAAHNTDEKVSLSSFRGRPTIVSFLPLAFTGG
jgi:peroxiredoxin